MQQEIIEMGKISSRGQIAIPSEIRSKLKMEEGSKVIFFLEDEAVIMKKVNLETFSQITKPLRKAKKKIKEDEVVKFIHKKRRKD